MSNLIQIQNLSKYYGAKTIFSGASLSINEGEHIGVIGPNGAGKTTLFKIITNQIEKDDGSIIRSQNLRLGYLAQHDLWSDEDTVESYLSEGTTMPLWDMKSLGRGLGLSDEIYSKKIKSLSGGYRMRAKLLHLLGEEPNLLLLDEPTNYLDLESLLVLERFLIQFKHSFLLISHDREFLRKTTRVTVEVEQGGIEKFPGNLDEYFEFKNLSEEQLLAKAEGIEQKKKEILDFVARFGAKATKAKQAQSRLKMLGKLEEVDVKKKNKEAVIHLPSVVRTGKNIFSLEDVSLGYGEKVVLKNVRLQLQRGDRLSVVGVNGAGKSTLLKGISKALPPLTGKVEYGHLVSIGFYAQHVAESLDEDWTVFECLQKDTHPEVTQKEILNLAGALLFSGDDIHKKIKILSGGEKSRVALGQILLKRHPCLILDEPTNHLDFETVEALTEALKKFDGTVVVVSHDRNFVKNISTKILEIQNGEAHFYPGTYEEYLWSVEKGMFSERSEDRSEKKIETKSSEPSWGAKQFQDRKEKQKRLREISKNLDQVERKLEKMESRKKELNELLIKEPSSSSQREWIEELGEIHEKNEEAELLWMSLHEEKESLSE